ncbi:uncharacterized protein LOC125946461 isoform X2 [Dermacentor silvarum]|uniref:uncharacterized protein LOC125946461 isoform X2 n=1 Tax=Dermacentor silvarum TaxID=543639 RepID=UPI0021017D68|nr:uncharacterized protein LOC125946461 isoform X2 [Dermacentor silvarum]
MSLFSSRLYIYISRSGELSVIGDDYEAVGNRLPCSCIREQRKPLSTIAEQQDRNPRRLFGPHRSSRQRRLQYLENTSMPARDLPQWHVGYSQVHRGRGPEVQGATGNQRTGTVPGLLCACCVLRRALRRGQGQRRSSRQTVL